MMKSMNAGGFGLVLMFFSFPILIPLPPPLPSLIALPLIIFSLQMMAGLTAPKLPKIISQKSIERQLVAKIIEKASFLFTQNRKNNEATLIILKYWHWRKVCWAIDTYFFWIYLDTSAFY